jgi:hypothetical protein
MPQSRSLHRRSPLHRSLSIGVALVVVAPALACVMSGNNGDPGRDFESSGGHHHAPGYAGGAGAAGASGTAGTPATDGGAGDASVGDAHVGDARGGDGAPSDGAKVSPCLASATSTFAMSWTVEDGTGAASTCAAQGGATVDITVVDPTSGATEDLSVPCATMQASTCAMPAGAYSVTLRLRNAGGDALAEVVAPTLFLVDGTSTPVGSVPFEVGGADATSARGFALTWSIEQSGGGAAETCAQAGAATVRLVAGSMTYDLPCADGKGRTSAVVPADYAVTVHLLDAHGADLSVTQTMTLFVDEGQLVFLGNVVFDVI